jgi:hypothetical protein
MTETTQWEYQAISLGSFWNIAKPEEIEAALNQLGAESWEVVSVYTHHGSNKTHIVAKRPLSGETRRQRSWPG